MNTTESVAVARSVESLPSNPAAQVPGVRNFNLCPEIVSGVGPDIVLTTHSGRPALVYLSSVLIQRLLLSLQAFDSRAFGL